MHEIKRLQTIMAALRNPENGCPWDLKQDHRSLIPYLIEEAYEVIEAIETGNDNDICEELGDLLFQIIFHAQLASETNRFSLSKIASSISDKLIRRHPHVFANTQFINETERESAWQAEKALERAQKQPNQGILSGVPKALAALKRAQKLQHRAANVGFDWDNALDVIPKIQEELEEVSEAIAEQQEKHIEEEVGDLLFSVVNLARKLNIDAENALRMGNQKFEHRFNHIEVQLKKENQPFEQTPADKLEALWVEAKQSEK